MKTINIFTDGSAINNGTPIASGGFGIYMVEPNIRISMPYVVELATNQRCELYAILRALELVMVQILEKKMVDHVIIYSDSMYCINVCSKWIPSWKTKGWKTSEGKEVKNLWIVQQIDHLQVLYYKLGVKLEYKFVGSHREEPKDKKSEEYFRWRGNDVADKLSKKGSIIYLKKFIL